MENSCGERTEGGYSREKDEEVDARTKKSFVESWKKRWRRAGKGSKKAGKRGRTKGADHIFCLKKGGRCGGGKREKVRGKSGEPKEK